MEKYITNEYTGLRYELVGDYYLIAGKDGITDTCLKLAKK